MSGPDNSYLPKYTYVIDGSDAIYDVGQNDYGQLGLGNQKPLVYSNVLDLAYSETLNDLSGTVKYVCNNGQFSIAVMTDGSVYGIGDNSSGQLGLGNNITYTSWQSMPLPTGKVASRIACGYGFTIVMMTDGTVYGTGNNGSGQLGIGNSEQKKSLTPMIMPAGKLASKIYCSYNFTIVLMTDKTIYGAGSNGTGALGLGSFSNIPVTTLTPMIIPSGKIPSKIACGGNSLEQSTVVLMLDNTIYGTGSNARGQLGLGNTNNQSTLTAMIIPTDPSGSKIPMKIACGIMHTVVLMLDETLYGTGNNGGGALGLGNTSQVTSLTSIPLPSGKKPTNISCNDYFTIVLMVDETVYGTGSNDSGQLGTGDTSSVKTLTQMPLYDTKPTQIFTGSRCTFVQMYDSMVYATGLNNNAQLGINVGAYLSSKIIMPAGKTPFLVESTLYFTVVLMTDGTIYGTGYNNVGQLGTGNILDASSLTPMNMTPTAGKTPYKIACGVGSTFVLMTDGSLYITGRMTGFKSNPNYSLSLFTNSTGKTPVNVACGYDYAILLMSDGTLYGAGSNLYNQLGINNNPINSLTNIPIPAGKTASKVVCSNEFTIVLMSDASGSIYGTGVNTSGQLGDGTNTNRASLTLMTNTTGKIPAKIACGVYHTVVLMKDGTLYATGNNTAGQLGNGTYTNTNTLTPMTMPSGKVPLSIACGPDFTIVLMKDGTLYGTGANSYSQLSTGEISGYDTLQQMKFSNTLYASNIVYLMNTSVVNTKINVASTFNKTFGDAPFPLNATTNNNQTPIVYTSANTNIVTVDSSGIVTISSQAQSVSNTAITLFQNDTADFNAGTATTTINIKYNSTITVASSFNKVYGDNSFSLDASSNNNQTPIIYTSDSSAVTVNSSGVVTIVSATDASYATITLSQISTSSYNAGSTTTRIYVAKKTTVITVNASFNKVYGDVSFNLGATSNGNPSTITYVSDSSAVTVNSSGVVTIVSSNATLDPSYATITLSQTSTTNYTSAISTTRIYVAQKTTVITVDASFNKVYGTDVSFNLGATSNGNPNTITYTSDSSAVTVNSSGVVTIVSATGSSYATITLSQVSNTNYTSGTATTRIYVAKKTTVITVDASFNKIYGATPFPLDASSNGNPSPFVYTPDSSAVTIDASGVVTIHSAISGYVTVTISQVTSTNYTSGTTSTLIYIEKQQTVVNVDASFNKVYGDASFNLGATSNNTESPFSYLPDSSAVTIDSNGVVTINSAVTGYVNVVVSKAASTDYTDGSANTKIYIAEQPTVIHVDASFNKVYGDDSFNLNATSNNIEANITYLSDSSAVTVDASGNVTIVSAINGSYATITLSQESTTDYTSATATTRIYVAKQPTTIHIATIPTKTYGTDVSFNLDVSSNNVESPFNYSSSNESVVTVNNGVVTIHNAGTATIYVSQSSSTNYTDGSANTDVYVEKETTVITIAPIPNKVYGTDVSFNLDVSSNNVESPIRYVSDSSAVSVDANGVVTIHTAGTAIITATQITSTNYTDGSSNATVYVEQETTVINVDASFNKVYGTDVSFNLGASSNNIEAPITYTSDSPAVTVDANGVVTIVSSTATLNPSYATIILTQVATLDYTSATTSTRIYVAKETTTITVDASFNKVYGTDVSFNLGASSNNIEAPITYTSDSSAVTVDANGVVTIVSSTATLNPSYATITLTQVDTLDYTSATTSTRIYVDKETTTIIVDASFNKVYGTDVSFNLGASSNNIEAPITYISDSSAVTVDANGVVTIVSSTATLNPSYATITLTQVDTLDYTSATTSTRIYVAKETTIIAVDASFNKVYGTDVSFNLGASSNNIEAPITYTSDSSAVTVDANGVVTIVSSTATLNPSYATITLTQVDTLDYTSATTSTRIYVDKETTVIDVSNNFHKVYGTDVSFNLEAVTNNIETPIIYTSDSSAVTVDESGVVTIVSATDNTYATITLYQADTFNYTSATNYTHIYVGKETAVINVDSSFNKVYGTDVSFNLDASSNNNEAPITYISDSSAVTVDASGVVTIVSATGDTYATITLSQVATLNYDSATTYTRIYVAKKQTIITVDASFNKIYGAEPFYLGASSNGNPSPFVYTPDSSAVTIDANGLVTIHSAVPEYVTVAISQETSTNYTSETTTTKIYIAKQQTVINVNANFNKVYGTDVSFNLDVSSNNVESSFIYTSLNTSVVTVENGIVTIHNAGTATIVISQLASTNYTDGSANTTINVARETTVISITPIPDKVYGIDVSFNLNVSSNNIESSFNYYSSNQSVATVNNGVVTIVGAGTVTITVSQSSSTNYTDGSANTGVYIARQQTVINVDASFNVNYGVQSFYLNATTNNTQTPIIYLSDSSAVSVDASGYVIILGGVDPYATITLTQDASTNYTDGSANTKVYVGKQTTIITVNASFNKVYGDASFNLDASSNNIDKPIVYSSSDPSTVYVNPSTGSVTILHAVNTDIPYVTITLTQASSINYTSATATTNIYVAKQATTINVTPTFNKVYGDVSFNLNPTSNNSESPFVYTTDSSAITVNTNGVVTILTATDASGANITITKAVSTDYTSGIANTVIYVSKLNTTLTNSSITLYTKYAGNPPFSLSPTTNNAQSAINYISNNTNVATVDGSGVITIVSSTGATTTTPVSVIITMNQNANINYNASNIVNVTVNVYKATTVINVASTFTKQYGSTPFSLGATSNNPTAISYVSGNTNVATVDGSGNVTVVSVGNATITLSQQGTNDFSAGNANTTITVTKKIPVITVVSSLNKTFGDASFNLDASSTNVATPITYSSSNTAIATVNTSGVVTIISSGTVIITSSQVADTNYTSASATTTITVTKKPIRIVVDPSSAILLPSTNIGISGYVTVTPSGTTNSTVTYSSGTTTVATVGASNGTITYVGIGTSIITITASPTLTTASTYSASTATFTVTYVYTNNTITDASNNVLTQINTIKQISGGYNTNTTTYKYANCCGLDASSNLMVVGYQASPTSNIGCVAISRNGGSTWLPCTMPVAPSNITDVCFKGVSTSAYCAIYGSGQKMMYASIDISTNFVLNTSSSASTISGVRFASSGTTPCTNSSGICLAGITGYTLKGTSGFSGSMSRYFSSDLNALCFDSPDDNANYSIYAGNWGYLKYCTPTSTFVYSVSSFPTPTSSVYAIATSSGLAKTLYMTSSATYLLSNLTLSSGNGTYTLLSTGATGKLPSTCGSGVTGNLMRICSMSLNGNVMAVIDANTIANGNVSKSCYYSVNGGTTWINLTARFNINDTFVSVQVSRDGNYILLQAASCVYKLALSS